MFYNDVDPKLLHQGKLLAAREARLVALEWDEATIVTMTYLQRLWGDLVNAKPELSAELTALHRKHNLGSFVTSCFVGIVFVLRADVSREWIQDATPNDIVLLAQEELSDDDSPANRAIALSVMDEEDDEDYLTDEERKDILAVFGSESIDLAGFEPAFYVGMLSTDEWCPSEV